MKTRISVLDLSPVIQGEVPREALKKTLRLARAAEAFGFERYWLAEHHGMRGIATSSPEIVMNQVLNVTETIRVGSGGIMLPNHAPLKVAETFRTLGAFHPGRVDLGIGRAPGTDQRTALALRGSIDRLRADDFPEKFADLLRYLMDEGENGIVAMPMGVEMPEVWLLGSSDFSAKLAAQLGIAFAFADHFSQLPAKPIVEMYKSLFRPSRFLKEPKVMIGAHVICGDTQDEANRLALSSDHSFYELRMKGQSVPLISPQVAMDMGFRRTGVRGVSEDGPKKFVGSVENLKEILGSYLDDVGVDEVIVTSFIYDIEARIRSYDLLRQVLS